MTSNSILAPNLRDPWGWVVPVAVGLGAIVIGVVVCVLGPAVAAAPFAIVLAGWVWLRMPGVLLAMYLFLGFYKATLGPLSPVDLTPLLALANASQVILLLGSRDRIHAPRLGLALWGALGLLVLAGVIWAGQQSLALDRASFWWILILLPSVAAVRVASERRFVDQFLATGLVVGCVVVVLGLPNLFGPARLAVIGENTLQTGVITLIVVLLSVFWLLRVVPLWARPIVVVLIVVALIESVASGSRGPLLAFMAALGFGFASRVLSGRPLTRRDVGLAALASSAVVALVIAISSLPGQSIARLLALGDVVSTGGPLGSSIGARLDLFSLATQMFVDRPLLGNGTGAFAAYTTTHIGLVQYTYPHNDLLQMAAEFGIVGAGLFVFLMAVALLRRIPETAAWVSTRVVLVFLAVYSLSSGDIYSDRLMWGLLILVLSAPLVVDGTAPVVAALRRPRRRAPVQGARAPTVVEEPAAAAPATAAPASGPTAPRASTGQDPSGRKRRRSSPPA
jgi:O-antigen ligase